MVTVRMTKGDYDDEFTYTCSDDEKAAINLSGSTVKLYVGRFGSTLLVDGADMTISDAPNGVVTYKFAEGVVAVNKYYDAQIEINWSVSGKKRLIPFTIHVMPQLA